MDPPGVSGSSVENAAASTPGAIASRSLIASSTSARRAGVCNLPASTGARSPPTPGRTAIGVKQTLETAAKQQRSDEQQTRDRDLADDDDQAGTSDTRSRARAPTGELPSSASDDASWRRRIRNATHRPEPRLCEDGRGPTRTTRPPYRHRVQTRAESQSGEWRAHCVPATMPGRRPSRLQEDPATGFR